MDEKEVRTKSRRGTLWTMGGQGASFVVLLVAEGVRGRLLTPAEVGVYTAALVLTGVVAYIGEFGLGSEIVRRRALSDAQLSAAHRAMVLGSIVLGAACFLVSPLLGWWYQNPEVVPLAQLLSWSFLLQGPGLTPKALLTRELRFRALVGIDLAAAVASLAVLGVMAWFGYGAWSLAVSMLVGHGLRTLLLRLTHRWRPVRPDWTGFRSLLVEGARITGSRVLYYAQENVDRLVLGRFAGDSVLGIYSRAVMLASLPTGRVAAVFNVVAYPSFAALVQDPPALRRHYLSTVRDISLLSMPTAIGLAVVAHDAVLTVYGPTWLGAVPVMQAVCVVGLARSVRVVAPAVFIARGEAGYNLWLSGVSAVVHAVGFAIGAAWGLTGMAVVFLVAIVPLNVAILLLATRAVGVGLGELATAIVPAGLRAAAMGVVVGVLLSWVPSEPFGLHPEVGAATRLVLGVGVGIAVYGALTWFTDGAARRFIQRRVRKLVGR